jgi:hypothetical protein
MNIIMLLTKILNLFKRISFKFIKVFLKITKQKILVEYYLFNAIFNKNLIFLTQILLIIKL